MEQCPQCGQAVEKELFCRTCGHPLVDGGEPSAPGMRPRARKSHLVVVLMAFVVVGAGSLMLVASGRRAPATSAPARPAATNAEPSPPQHHRADVAAAPAAHSVEWIVREPSYRSRQSGIGVTFELAADSEVDVWRKRVRPVLTVRCSGKDTEVFIVTHTPASIEDNTRLHSVTVAFDGVEAPAARWEHSVDHDALFAPDGGRMARQIASADKMTFTFTPFNAPDTAVQFSVAGLGTRLDTAARHCTRRK